MDEQLAIRIDAVDRRHTATVGGKGANLGELTRIVGVQVPAGFCVTTRAFARVMSIASIDEQLAELVSVDPADRASIGARSADLRRSIEAVAVPDDLLDAVAAHVAGLGLGAAYAVRSSATAEDTPTASFAGQHDSFLHVVGTADILDRIRRCWASTFSERAVRYRQRHGIDHRDVHMAVVVQPMLAADAAGILFTADPANGNRKVAAIEATPGLGHALVSGLVNPDVYKVRDGEVVVRSSQAAVPVLADDQVLRLAELGRRIEAHFGAPQDIEWCLVADELAVVQSRPITTLFPIPDAGDGENRVYVSVGHQQMMTDAMKPLGLSFWQLTTRAPMRIAGGRLFVDVTNALASTATRAGILDGLGRSDPLIGDALRTIVDRGDFLPPVADGDAGPPPAGDPPPPLETDPAIVDELMARTRSSIAAAHREISATTGTDLFDCILADTAEMRQVLFDPRSLRVVGAGMEAAWWLNDRVLEWLGERNVADTLAQSAPNNVTAEMGLALLDVADVIRPHPQVVRVLESAHDGSFLDELLTVEGGTQARQAIERFLDDYGMRCVGEIDITRPRWSEQPATLLPVLLGNVTNFEPGEAARRFEQGRRRAQGKEREVLERLRALPGGDAKAAEAKRMIDRVRCFTGYREHPKYGMVSRYLVYKRALLVEADRLVRSGVLRERDDIHYLTFDELREVVRTDRVDDDLVVRRKAQFESYRTLTPPRVLTSDGEALTGTYRRDGLPADALVGLPVSAGTVEGRARVVLDMAAADLEPGDILVTAYTDPSWTPVFVTIAGLVTEAGGQMTHGAVIAREYGLPAVVGVEHATTRISDGQRVRIHGTDGYVELVP